MSSIVRHSLLVALNVVLEVLQDYLRSGQKWFLHLLLFSGGVPRWASHPNVYFPINSKFIELRVVVRGVLALCSCDVHLKSGVPVGLLSFTGTQYYGSILESNQDVRQQLFARVLVVVQIVIDHLHVAIWQSFVGSSACAY